MDISKEYTVCPKCGGSDIEVYDYTVFGEGGEGEVEEKRVCNGCDFTWTTLYSVVFNYNLFD